MYAQGFQTYYSLHDLATDWSDAVQICQAEGSALLKPDSLNEVENLKLLMSNMRAHYEAIFVGLHDKFSDGDFVTLKGIFYVILIYYFNIITILHSKTCINTSRYISNM